MIKEKEVANEFILRRLSTQEHLDLMRKFRALSISHLPPNMLVQMETMKEEYELTNTMSSHGLKWIADLYDEYR